jgi:hypothetical protein
MEARGPLIVCREDKGLPACPDESLDNLEMPISTRNMETRKSARLFYLEKKDLPAYFDQSIRNLEMPV